MKVAHIDGALGDLDVDEPHGDTAYLECQPGRDVAIVVEPGDDDLVARLQLALDRAADGKGEGRHVGAEDDLVGGDGIEEGRGRMANFRDQGVRLPAGRKDAALVGINRPPVFGGAVDDALRHLRAGGIVEVDDRLSIDLEGERGELRANGLQVDVVGGRHQRRLAQAFTTVRTVRSATMATSWPIRITRFRSRAGCQLTSPPLMTKAPTGR